MKFLLPTFAVASWMPHVEGDARWVLLGAFMGLVCLLVRAA